MILSSSQVLKGAEHRFFLDKGLFISIHHSDGLKAMGLVLNRPIWSEFDFSRAIELLMVECKDFQGFKIIGTSKQVEAAGKWLKTKNLPVIKQYCYDGGLEVIFKAQQGKIQVARQEAEPKNLPVESANEKVKVLIVDDSKTIRSLLSKILSSDPTIDVVATAEKPSEVEGLILKFKPDVITLDIHMPEMDGVTLLKRYMAHHPTPTVMITSISIEEGPKVLEALESGAVDYIQKPTHDQLAVMAPLIIEKVKVAKKARLVRAQVTQRLSGAMNSQILVAIGSSTGGTEALKSVLTQLPENIPPIVIVQHIPPVFSKAFADRMNSLCPFEVKEAENNDEIRPGRVLIAPGGTQMRLKKQSGGFVAHIFDGEPVNRHKPSVDVLFDSVAELCGPAAIGVILTGMGADGAKGLLNMKKAGSRTIAQDESTCVVFGMPREAIELGAADKILPLGDVPQQLMTWLAAKRAA